MNSMHDEQALAAAYVLGALEPGERRDFEAHAATCPVCLEEVRSLQRVTAALAHTVPQRTPNPELRTRVLSAIGAAPHVGVERQPRVDSRSWLPLAAAVLLTAGLGIYAWSLQQRVSTLEVRLNEAERRASSAERDTPPPTTAGSRPRARSSHRPPAPRPTHWSPAAHGRSRLPATTVRR